jgi:pimeloyl-ACP methyl ester carboxylesterase
MPFARVNSVRLRYESTGSGEPVVMVMGTGAGHRVWHLHQVPALVEAGYRVITFDNRGIAPSDVCAEGFTVEDLTGDVAGLIRHLDLGPCHLIGTSMGAYVVQELLVARPELARGAVLLATRGRSDALRAALARSQIELWERGIELPARYRAVAEAMRMLGPRTLNDDKRVDDWLDLFELSPPPGPGVLAQLRVDPMPDRLSAYRSIRVPCHVIAFADDLVTPPAQGRELADAIPGATFDEIEGCGHYGYLEEPEAVNASILSGLRARHAG